MPDRPTQADSADLEIEVTPEMLAAAERIYEQWQESSEWDYMKVFARMYRAMAAVAPNPPRAPQEQSDC